MEVRCPRCGQTNSVLLEESQRETNSRDGGYALIVLMFLVSGGELFYEGSRLLFASVPEEERGSTIGMVGISTFFFLFSLFILSFSSGKKNKHEHEKSTEPEPSTDE